MLDDCIPTGTDPGCALRNRTAYVRVICMTYGRACRAGLTVALSLLAAGAAGCVGDIGDGGAENKTPPGVTENFAPQAPVMRRLLARQYLSSVRDLLGVEAAAAAVAPADQPLNGFDAIGASTFNVGDAVVV